MNWLIFFINLSFILGTLVIVLAYMVVSYRNRFQLYEQDKGILKRQEEEIEWLLNDSGILVFKHDISGKITHINTAVRTQLGLSPETMTGKQIQSIMCSKRGVSWDNYIQDVFREKKSEGIFYLINSDSDVIPFAYKCNGMIEDNLMVGVYGYAWRVETEGQGYASQEAKPKSFEKQLWQTHERYKKTAHNLKNIFAAVLGFSEIIKEEELSLEDIRNYNTEICAAGKRGVDLLTEWLDSPSVNLVETEGGGEFDKTDEDHIQNHTAALKKGKGRIMYVDDNKALLLMYERFLEKLGYLVDGYNHANEALLAFEQESEQYDLVITDWLMPEMSGKELVEKIKSKKSDMPIIVLSGKNISESINFEIFSILEKPVNPVKMSEIIGQALALSSQKN